ncbi:MAG: substrate-binding domain-containing protein [Rubrivivax sp.]|nr:substrate-binding domain-containing protein [Rubrivivax sp.]
MTTDLQLLCAGAAQGLVKALQERFRADTGAGVQGRFGAVGAMKEALLAGEPCDLMVLTEAMVRALATEGRLRGETCVPLGRVRTGVAVRSGQPRPDVSTPEALKAALLAADAIHFPDPVRATAGIHFANVMRELGIFDTLQPRFRTYPNGATAMRELAASPGSQAIGCTQVTEIKYTQGVDLVGVLPPRFELATVYSAAVATAALQPELAARFIALLCGRETQDLRAAGGFEA